MYFTECARLADRHPDLADIVQRIDAQLEKMGATAVMRKDDLASFLRADPNQVSSVLELLAQDGLLRAVEMIECTYCRMAVLRADYEEVREEDGEYTCTSCDRLLNDSTVKIIAAYRRGKTWRDNELSPSLAAAVVATLSLHDLRRVRGIYPSAICDEDAKELQEALSAHLSIALDDESLSDIRDSLYQKLELDGPDADAVLTVLLTTLVMRCPDVHIAGSDEETMRTTMDQAVAACRDKASNSLKTIVDRLIEIKLLDCRIPEGEDPAFSDPRRALQLLQAYWSLGRSIVLNQMNAFVSLQPHPLMRLVMNLQSRMDTYFGRLSDHDGSLDASSAGDRLLELAVGGDLDEISAVPEWTHQEVRTVDSFLERTRLKVGSKTFPLTHEEKVFIEQAETAIEDYRQQASKTWARIVEGVDRQNTPASENAESNQRTQTDYCCVLTREGTATLPKSGYDNLVKSRDEYGMYIDGMTREASCRDGNGKPRTAKLTAKELGILVDVITAGKPVRPHATKTGSECASAKAAIRLFEGSRRKVDVQLGRYEYRAFRLHRSAGSAAYKAFEFAPPDDLQYCVITPV